MNNHNQEHTTASSEYVENSSLIPLFSQFPNQQITDMGITGVETRIEQIPTAENGNAAICSGKVTTGQGSFSGIGVATPDMCNGSNHPNHLIHAAEMDALKIQLEAAFTFGNSKHATIDVTPASQSGQQRQDFPKKKYTHSASKPMSPNQQKALESIAQQHGTTLSAAAQETVGKPVDQLSSQDANALFKKFNGETVF